VKVLIVTTAYPNRGNPAEGLFHEQQALALRRAGVTTTVVVCKPWLPASLAKKWERYRFLAPLPQAEEREGIPVLYSRYIHLPSFHFPGLTARSCGNSILRSLRRFRGGDEFDVIQVHGAYPAGLAMPRIAEVLRCPFVLTIHIQDPPDLFSSGSGRSLYRGMLEKASAVVAVGRPLERFLGQFQGAAAAVRIIPNGVDLETIEKVMNTSLPREWSGGRIVSVANLWSIKGIDLNLKALANLDSLGIRWDSYTVVGDGPERKRLERLAQELNIGHRVFFRGRLPHKEALKEVAEGDILSLPSWQEAFGVAYLEAMACGKPVIGCRGQGAEDIIRHEKEGLLIQPHDVDALTSAMGRLLKDPGYACSLGRAAVKRAREFTWERTSAEYLDVYHEAVRDKGRKGGATEGADAGTPARRGTFNGGPRLHLGCANLTPAGWVNLDGSWNAWLAKHSILRWMFRMFRLVPQDRLGIRWNQQIIIHDVRKELPFTDNHFIAIYASHLLEHLYLGEARSLLRECHRVLKPGGTARFVVPDLRSLVLDYVKDGERQATFLAPGEVSAADRFCQRLAMRTENASKTNLLYRIYSMLKDFHTHKWMFDADSLTRHLREAGFVNISKKSFLDSRIPGIEDVERKERAVDHGGVCVEGEKPLVSSRPITDT
jgi:teichuronic acid biosynthesis glycosyltransferase TuaC